MLAKPYKYLFSVISNNKLCANSILFYRAIIKNIKKIKIVALTLIKSTFLISFSNMAINKKSNNNPPKPI